jgi:hypothetical protein
VQFAQAVFFTNHTYLMTFSESCLKLLSELKKQVIFDNTNPNGSSFWGNLGPADQPAVGGPERILGSFGVGVKFNSPFSSYYIFTQQQSFITQIIM